MPKSFIRRALAIAALTVIAGTAAAQSYPARPIRLLVPYPPGGGTDQVARVVAGAVAASQGWTIVVENKPGAGGNVGLDTVAHAKPDGHTLLLSQTENVVLNPLIFSKLTYDPINGFAPIALIAKAPMIVVAKADSPLQSLKDVVAAARAKPDAITFATSGIGSTSQIAQQLWQRSTGVSMTHVPYRGAAAAIPDLIGGQVSLYSASIPTVRAQVESGALRALGVTATQRLPAMPNVPTFAESGYPDVEIATMWGVMAPAGTPADIIARWNQAVNAALRQPDVRARILDSGAEIVGGTPEQMGQTYAAERERLGVVIRSANIRLD